MALAVNLLTSGSSTTDASSYVTASVSPTANALICVVYLARKATGNPATPTITGNGLTYTEVVTNTTSPLNFNDVALFRALDPSPTSGAITIDFGETVTSCIWFVFEITGVDTSGTNGSGAVVQSVGRDFAGGAGTSGTLTLSALGSANNMAVGGFFHFANEATTPGSGFTEIGDINLAENTRGFQTEYALNDTTVDASWASSVEWEGVAIEVKAASTYDATKDMGSWCRGLPNQDRMIGIQA